MNAGYVLKLTTPICTSRTRPASSSSLAQERNEFSTQSPFGGGIDRRINGFVRDVQSLLSWVVLF